MPIANAIKEALGSGSMIRRMFEEGNLLRKKYGAGNVYDFSLGNPDIEPPPAFHRVFLKLAREDRKGSHGYMPNGGFPEVREEIAAKVSKEQNASVDGSHLVMAAGAAGGLNTVLKTILDPGDEVIVSKPYFMEYRPYTANHGGKLLEVEALSDFNLDVGAVAAKLSERTAAVIINSPNNPTGRIYPAETVAALADALRAHGKRCGRFPFLVSDEPYREISYGIPVPPVLSAYEQAVVVYSYSKSLSLPGERIGFIAVSPDMPEREEFVNGLIYATRVLGFVNAPALMQRIVAELIFARVDVDVYAARRDAFREVLDAAGISYAEPEGAFYFFCRVPHTENAEKKENDLAFAEHLKNRRILAVPGSGFGKPGWIRFAYCVDEKIIKAAGPAFKKAVEDWLN